ncbi:hypothetical protein GT3921_01495 [Geobacillus thermocatenulatus]|nr:hypothetical protein GT3921_01495 [Geobacillus thermocatenulatus]
MQFEALTVAFTEHWHLIDCRATEQHRFQTHVWVCEAMLFGLPSRQGVTEASLWLAFDSRKMNKRLFHQRIW